MSFGSKNWMPWIIDDKNKIMDLMKEVYDKGINTFDTADVYSNGLSEQLIGEFLKKYKIKRSPIVILSKCYNYYSTDPNDQENAVDGTINMNPYKLPYVNQCGLSRKYIIDAVNASVERLGTYIDVLQVHRYDPTTPDKEIMETLHHVVQSGKVRYIGASTMKAYQFANLQSTAAKHGFTKFISMQNHYNLLYREEEREMIPYCEETGVGIIPWAPLASGLLTRPFNPDSERSGGLILGGFKDMDEAIKKVHTRVENLAKGKNVLMSQIALAWLFEKGGSPTVGLTSVKRIEEAIEALNVRLTEDDIKYLEDEYKPQSLKGYF